MHQLVVHILTDTTVFTIGQVFDIRAVSQCYATQITQYIVVVIHGQGCTNIWQRVRRLVCIHNSRY